MVFAPLGVHDADLDPERHYLNAWGGWRVSTTAYALMLDYYRKGLPIDIVTPFDPLNYTYKGYFGPVLFDSCISHGEKYCRIPHKKALSTESTTGLDPMTIEFVQWKDEVSYVASYRRRTPYVSVLQTDLEAVVYPEAASSRR